MGCLPAQLALALGTGDGHAFAGAELEQVDFEFGEGGQDVEEHLAEGVGGVVDGAAEGELDAAGDGGVADVAVESKYLPHPAQHPRRQEVHMDVGQDRHAQRPAQRRDIRVVLRRPRSISHIIHLHQRATTRIPFSERARVPACGLLRRTRRSQPRDSLVRKLSLRDSPERFIS